MLKSFVKLLCVVALANTVLAQDIFIALPKPNTDVLSGSDITVELDKPTSLTGSTEVAIVIAVTPCDPDCPDPSDVLGDILYNGPYYPQPHPDRRNPYENFTVAIPPWYEGPIQLAVAHFFLLGAGEGPRLQLAAIPLNAVQFDGDSQ